MYIQRLFESVGDSFLGPVPRTWLHSYDIVDTGGVDDRTISLAAQGDSS